MTDANDEASDSAADTRESAVDPGGAASDGSGFASAGEASGGDAPGSARRQALDSVSALLEERGRYESWLNTLETRRDATPQHVYTRVRGDYESRLQRVMDQISGYSSDLRGAISEFEERIARLEDEETLRRDEKYEGELRAAVGEYEAGTWEELRRECDAAIERLSGQRSAVSAELARIRDIVSLTERPITPSEAPAVAEAPEPGRTEAPAFQATAPEQAAPPAAPPVPVPAELEPEPEPVASSAPVERVVESPPTRADEMAAPAPAFDELEFLKSVVGPRASESDMRSAAASHAGPSGAPAASAPRPAAPSAPAGGVSPPGAPPAGFGAPTQSTARPFAPRPAPRSDAVTPPRAPAVTSANPTPMPPAAHRATSPGRPAHPGPEGERGGSILDAPRVPAASEPVRPAEPARAPEEEGNRRFSSEISDGLRRFSQPRETPPTTPTFLKETPSDQAKTLQCQECGTMNYPTEWYCERCGGELAAM